MAEGVHGIHHITAISGDAQKNFDFYTGILGLRFIKKTINFDDPHTYHFYFGNYEGSPGTILTFFPWGDHAVKGTKGAGQISAITFSVQSSSLPFWEERLKQFNIVYSGPFKGFDEEVIMFYDHDGFELEICGSTEEKRKGWSNGEIPEEHSIRGFHTALFAEEIKEGTEELLIEHLGFRKLKKESNRTRYESGTGGPGTYVDILEVLNGLRGRMGVGINHHIAFRIKDDEAQIELRKYLTKNGYVVTDVRDRNYFHSIYFYEPGGILFEGATDPPGFTIDETLEELGTHLLLPPWFEKDRSEIENVLPQLMIKEKQRH